MFLYELVYLLSWKKKHAWLVLPLSYLLMSMLETVVCCCFFKWPWSVSAKPKRNLSTGSSQSANLELNCRGNNVALRLLLSWTWTDTEHSHCPSAAPHRRKETPAAEICGFVLKNRDSSSRQSSFIHTKQNATTGNWQQRPSLGKRSHPVLLPQSIWFKQLEMTRIIYRRAPLRVVNRLDGFTPIPHPFVILRRPSFMPLLTPLTRFP